MGYAEAMLKRYGQDCTILGDPEVATKVLKKRHGSGTDPSRRDSTYRGVVLATSSLVSGKVMSIAGQSYLMQSVMPDPVYPDALSFFAVKCNTEVTLQRYTETADVDGNRTPSWPSLGMSPAWAQVVTARMRQEDPGLLDNARYLVEVPTSLGVRELDRIVLGGSNYKVESIDDVAMPGVVRVQLSIDTRP